MTDIQVQIMRHFRSYRAGVSEMLFFNSGPAVSNPPQFSHAMASLVRSGHVVQERPRGAYSLTQLGYQASLSV